MNKSILVTGIGGNVGQGILRNIIRLNYNFKIVGTDTSILSAGNHLCDIVYTVPYAFENNYIKTICKICDKNKIALIIPSTDYEIYYLGLNASKLPTIACTSPQYSYIFLNKYQTSIYFNKYNIPFAKTCLPSKYINNFKHFIVKPSEGRGSRDIYINPQNVNKFSDDNIVQQYYVGKEITTAFYVTKESVLLGQITFLRQLKSGMTNICEVVFDYDNKINEIITNILKHFDIKGSCNIQSIVTKNGRIVPFEVNCRISGTNSIRSNFGFDDVRYTIEEYLLNIKPSFPIITKGSAVRINMDIIYPGISLKEIKNKTNIHYIY